MKKRSTFIGIFAIIAVVVAAMVYVLLQSRHTETPEGAGTNDSQQTDAEDTHGGTVAAQGRYEEYSEETFNQAEGRRVLFFYAPWCPQCRALDASIRESNVPNGVVIFKVDYDSNQAMRQKYGVTIQTTLVEVDANGNKVKKYVAYDSPTFNTVKAALGL
jgi:thiol-disulfide isomerase/thioredoxin